MSALGQYFGSESALRRLVAAAHAVGGAQPHHRHSAITMVLRWAGCLDGGPAACHRSARSSFYAKSDYFDKPLSARAAAQA